MKIVPIAGIALLLLGAFLVLRGGSFSTRRDVLKVGDVKITADEERQLPTWVGAVAVVAGIAILATGMRQRA